MVTAVERWEPTGIKEVDRAVASWRPATMVPAQFKDKRTGRVLLEDLALAAHWLYALDVPPIPNIPSLYVVKGRVGVMADLQRALLARAGYDLEVAGDETSATARIRPPGGAWKPPVTVTMAQAQRAGWAARSPSNPDQPSNYELLPDRMLAARACTKAISLYAPGVLRGLTGRAASVAELADDDEEVSGPAGAGEVSVSGPEPPQLPARSVAPDGSTVPEYLREDEVDPEVRARLIAAIEGLPDRVRADLLEAVRPIRNFPNIKTHRFTVAHGELLERLIREALLRFEMSDPAAPGARQPVEPAGSDPDQVPDYVYDRQPESVGALGEHAYRYDPADGRPFEDDQPALTGEQMDEAGW